jgi:hypothetical protein
MRCQNALRSSASGSAFGSSLSPTRMHRSRTRGFHFNKNVDLVFADADLVPSFGRSIIKRLRSACASGSARTSSKEAEKGGGVSVPVGYPRGQSIRQIIDRLPTYPGHYLNNRQGCHCAFGPASIAIAAIPVAFRCATAGIVHATDCAAPHRWRSTLATRPLRPSVTPRR